MGTVQQHQVAAFSGPNDGEAGTGASVKGNDDALRDKVNDHDADATIHVQASTLASRPAAGTAGRFWITKDGSDAPLLWYDDGADWVRCSTTPATRYEFATNTTFQAGSIYKSATDGVVIGGDAGSSYSAAIYNSAGAMMAGFGNSGVVGETGLALYDITAGTARRVKKKLFSALVAGDEVLVFV